MMRTLVRPGRDVIRAFTTIFMPSFFETILSGRNALRALNALSDFKLSVPSPPVKIGISSSKSELITTKKSNTFQVDLM